jgi:hypothetical protein
VSGSVLTVSVGGATITETLTGTYGSGYFTVTTDGNGGIDVNYLPCFAEGTRVATPNGTLAVESLVAGDLVLTASGEHRPVRWIGYRTIDLTRHPAPERVQPIRIKAGAFGPGVPSSDLRLSPDHAVKIDDSLVPVKLLRNGTGIVRDTWCRSVTYYHVELDTHDILLAEGLPAESYLDTGNRDMFANAGTAMQLYADFGNDQARREAESCLPFVADPVPVQAWWRALVARAEAAGYGKPAERATTNDPDLHVVVDGRKILPSLDGVGRYRFVIPAGAENVRLVSRAVVPNEREPWFDEHRSLGVMVRRLTVHSGDDIEVVPLDHPKLRDGWWDHESDGSSHWRWTSGNAAVPFASEKTAVLQVDVGDIQAYFAVDIPGAAAVGRVA